MFQKIIFLYLSLLSFGDASEKEVPPYKEVICDCGYKALITDPDLLGVTIVAAKKDGPVIYLQDDRGHLYSFEEQTPYLKRTKIFRLPLVDTSQFDKENYLRLSSPTAKWAISYCEYQEGKQCITISGYELKKNFPVIIGNFDPWLPPEKNYQHPGPFDFWALNISASCDRVAMSGYTIDGQRGVMHRKMNFDSSGNNPFMSYKLPEGGYWPGTTGKTGQELLDFGITASVLSIPTPDWSFIPLTEEHGSAILLTHKGEEMIVPRKEGGFSLYNFCQQKWSEMSTASYAITYQPWLETIPTMPAFPKEVTACVNGMRGVIKLRAQEPLYGTFFSDIEKEGNSKSIDLYYVSRTLKEALENQKKFIDKNAEEITVEFL